MKTQLTICAAIIGITVSAFALKAMSQTEVPTTEQIRSLQLMMEIKDKQIKELMTEIKSLKTRLAENLTAENLKIQVATALGQPTTKPDLNNEILRVTVVMQETEIEKLNTIIKNLENRLAVASGKPTSKPEIAAKPLIPTTEPVKKRLERPITVKFSNAPLAQAFNYIRDFLSIDNANFVVDWISIEQSAGVNRSTEITLDLGTVPATVALEAIFEKAMPASLYYIVNDNTINIRGIVSERRKEDGGPIMRPPKVYDPKPIKKVYDISTVIAAMQKKHPEMKIPRQMYAKLILETIEKNREFAGLRDAVVTSNRDKLTVVNNQEGHEHVIFLLEKLRDDPP